MKKFLLILSVCISIQGLSQIKTNKNISDNSAENLTPFLDASSSSVWNNSTNNGKGLVFPRVDLTSLATIAGPRRPGNTNAPTRYDGMLVYNTVGGTPAIGANKTPNVVPGFYYYENKTNNLQGGHWVKVGGGATGNFWTLDGNGGTTPVTEADLADVAAGNYTFGTSAANKNFIGTTDAQNVMFATNNVARLEIGEKTNQTVGTENFNFVLDVYGKARFRDGIVTSNSTYPDYVFDNYFTGKSDVNPNYSFKSLTEVESFIKENNHLPGVTSIDELNKVDGSYEVDNAALAIQTLEKVEELYLHVIEQEKEIKALKAELAELKK